MLSGPVRDVVIQRYTPSFPNVAYFTENRSPSEHLISSTAELGVGKTYGHALR